MDYFDFEMRDSPYRLTTFAIPNRISRYLSPTQGAIV